MIFFQNPNNIKSILKISKPKFNLIFPSVNTTGGCGSRAAALIKRICCGWHRTTSTYLRRRLRRCVAHCGRSEDGRLRLRRCRLEVAAGRGVDWPEWRLFAG